MRKFLLFVILFSCSAFAQNSRFDGVVQARSGLPAPGAKVAICVHPCTVPTNVSISNPPSVLVPLCSSHTDAVCTQPNPVTADGLGNYGFYVAPGRYDLVFYGSGLTAKTLSDQILPCDPGNCAISGGTMTLTALTVTGASTLSSVTATSLGNILYAGGTAYPCTSVGINAMLLATPSPSGAVHAEGCGSFAATTNIFAGVTGTGAIFMPCGVISTAVVQTIPTNWIVHGCGGEIATGASLPTTGTVFKWTGGVAPATGVLNVFDTSHTNIYDIGIDCNSVASCVGINIDSDNTPISTFNSFTNILIMNAATGMQVGTAGGAQQVSALDVTGLRCVSVTDCVVSNSSNALAGAHFRHMTVSAATNGFHFIKGTFTQVEDCTGGNLTGSMFLVEYTISLIIKNCQSEPTGNFLTVQTNDNYTTPITLINNTINRPISVTQAATIISIGNHYTAVPTANNSALVTSIADKYDNGMEWALSGNSIINRLLANAVDGNPNQNYLTCGVGCNFTNLSNAVVASIGNTGAASFAGQITSTLATGTAPLVIASTTPVANLSINGGGTVDGDVIGGVTPAAGTFTTLTANTALQLTTGTISRHATFAGALGCTTAAAVGATCTSAALTWSSTLGDTSYFASCDFDGATTGVPVVVSITKTSATQFTATVAALTAVGATGSIVCNAWHN